MLPYILLPLALSYARASPIDSRGSSGSFDYIVIGGGASGLVVANRLSETAATVLVIEAGGSVFYNINVTATNGYGKALGTQIDWKYGTVAQVYADGSSPVLHAGKALGGTTTINGMSFTRAENAQIDSWEKIGNTGWNWANLFPYYLKSEEFQEPGARQIEGGAAYNGAYHGRNGSLKVGFPKSQQVDDFLPILNESYLAIGFPYSNDVSGGHMRGFNVFPMMIDVEQDVRHDAARAYYYPVQGRSNLQATLNTTVTKLLWAEDDSEGNAVVSGVEAVDADGKKVVFLASKEVILAAGALKTPALLELSGVGNPTILEAAGVDVKVDLPGVGENLIDQINTGMSYAIKRNKSYVGLANYVVYPNVTDVFGTEAAASLAASTLVQLPSWATAIALQNNNATNSTVMLDLLKAQYSLIFDSGAAVAELLHIPGTTFNSEFWGTLPFARGNIHINSSNPTESPSINPNYFMFDYDTKIQVGTAKYFRKIFASEPVCALAGDEITPGFSLIAADADDTVWNSWIKSKWRPNFHVMSTAIMMPRDMGGVVSDRLMVYGTANLRVADASIIPFQVCGHLTSTIYAIAERLSDLIKEDAGLV